MVTVGIQTECRNPISTNTAHCPGRDIHFKKFPAILAYPQCRGRIFLFVFKSSVGYLECTDITFGCGNTACKIPVRTIQVLHLQVIHVDKVCIYLSGKQKLRTQ